MGYSKEYQESFLKQAIETFPKGTKYIPIHLGTDIFKCTVSDPNSFRIVSEGNNHFYICESIGDHNKNGHGYTEVIYDCNKGWSVIIEKGDILAGLMDNLDKAIENYEKSNKS